MGCEYSIVRQRLTGWYF